ncbi:MAG: glycosyl hydrolase family 28-related protein [Byssovorax sp.]
MMQKTFLLHGAPLLGAIALALAAQGGCGPPPLRDAGPPLSTAERPAPPRDVMIGPFDSWLDVTHPERLGLDIPAARGDGVTDDTEALQAALDALGVPSGRGASQRDLPGCARFTGAPRATVLYLPAGRYPIRRTLRVYDRAPGIMIVGDAPETTTIEWRGPTWAGFADPTPPEDRLAWNDADLDDDMLLFDGGESRAAVRRISFDGRGRARAGLDFGYSGRHGGAGGEMMQVADVRLANLGYGIIAGGPGQANDADSAVRRVWFQDIAEAGLVTTHFNALGWFVTDSLFERCRRGIVERAGSVIVYDSLFVDDERDITLHHIHSTAIRHNLSTRAADFPRSGAPSFLDTHWFRLSELVALQGNVVIDPARAAGERAEITYARQGPGYFVDNAFFLPDAACASEGLPADQATPGSPAQYASLAVAARTPGDWQSRDPENRASAMDPFERAFAFSGNRCNGRPLPAPADLAPARTLALTAAPGPLAFGLDDADVARLRARRRDDEAARAWLRARLPQTPPRVDPHDTAKVLLADVPAALADPQDPQRSTRLSAFLRRAVDTALRPENETKLHVLHLPPGVFLLDGPLAIPGRAAMQVIGDGLGPTALSLARPDGAPMLAIEGPTARLTVRDLSLVEPAFAGADTARAGVIDLRIADTAGAEIRVEDTSSYGPGPTAIGGGFRMEGLDRAHATLDGVMVEGIEIAGAGAGISAGVDVFGITSAASRALSPFRVTGRARLAAHDMYAEQQPRSLDLSGGSGEILFDNILKAHVSPGAPAATESVTLGDFAGEITFFNFAATRPLDLSTTAPASQSVAVIGAWLSLSDEAPQVDQALRARLASRGASFTWQRPSMIDCAGLFGGPSATAAGGASFLLRGGSVDTVFAGAKGDWEPMTKACAPLTRGLDEAGAARRIARAFELLRKAPPRKARAVTSREASDVLLDRVHVESWRRAGIVVGAAREH